MKWQLEKENLEKYILHDNLSYESIGRIYGCSGNNIKKQAKQLGIILPQKRKINDKEHFNKRVNFKAKRFCKNCGGILNSKQKLYCSTKCQRDLEYKDWIIRWKNGEESGIAGKYGISNHLKRYLFEKYNNKCCKCGWNKINLSTSNCPLEIDHIDGNYKNNIESNLQLLCPNCHSLTSTYKGANIGKGRTNRNKYNYNY